MNAEDIAKDIQSAVEVLRNGGLILYPTDTIWGIGCDATNTRAVERLFELKHRPGAKAMISLVSSLDMLYSWVEAVPNEALEEIQEADRPLTVIYDSPKGISECLKAEDGSSAFRITSLPYTQSLCAELGKPVVSTSANISGEPSPALFDEINLSLLEGVDYVCRYGRERSGVLPSRIIKICNSGEKFIIRE